MLLPAIALLEAELMKKELVLRVSVLFILISLLFCLTACSNGLVRKISEKNVKGSVMLEEYNVGGLKESEARKVIDNYASKINVPAKDASIDSHTWMLTVKERPGKRVNVEKTLDALLKSNEGDKKKLITEEVNPGVTSEMLKSNCITIGTYTTPLLDKQVSRVNNIEIAANKIDFKKLTPDEEFSFNKTVGRRTEVKGYEDAPIIIKTEDGYKKGFGIGGGICQISSTLYNSVEKAGLEITERHIHSKDVGYIPLGKDATVSYDSVDFKFKNSKANPVMIRTYLTRDALTVNIIENRNK